MQYIGIALLLFGSLIIYNPDLVGILIGYLFVFIGLNMALMVFLTRRQNGSSSETKQRGESFRFGSYEIFKNKR